MKIGLCGRKGAGKDTAGGVFRNAHYIEAKMAGGLKAMLTALLRYQGVPAAKIRRMLEGDLKEVPSPYLGDRTPRYAMQMLGDQWGRQLISDDFWLRVFRQHTAKMGEIVVTDIRYPNETAEVDILVRITRPGHGSSDPHASEAHIDLLTADIDVLNDFGSPEEFRAHISEVVLPAVDIIRSNRQSSGHDPAARRSRPSVRRPSELKR